MVEEVKATAWCEFNNDNGYQYRLQISNVGGRSVKRVAKSCEGWREAGSGYNPKTGFRMLIFSKKFNTRQEWLKWAKQFPYKLVELNSKGEAKAIKLGMDFLEKNNRKKRK